MYHHHHSWSHFGVGPFNDLHDSCEMNSNYTRKGVPSCHLEQIWPLVHGGPCASDVSQLGQTILSNWMIWAGSREGWWLAGNEDQEGGSTLPAAAWCGNGMFCFFLLKPFIMTGPKSPYWLNHLWCTGNSCELMAKGGWVRSGWKVNGTGQAEIRLIKMSFKWLQSNNSQPSHTPWCP